MNEIQQTQANSTITSSKSTSKGRKQQEQQIRAVKVHLKNRPIVLIGMMGSGKTTLGRKLAKTLNLKFHDSDHEIELAAAMTIPDIFAAFGEGYFRQGEAKVIARLVKNGEQVLSLGGGAYLNDTTRELVNDTGISVWLNAPFDVLMSRLRRRKTRPLLLTDNPEDTVKMLISVREPIYKHAHIHVDLQNFAIDRAVREIIASLYAYFEGH